MTTLQRVVSDSNRFVAGKLTAPHGCRGLVKAVLEIEDSHPSIVDISGNQVRIISRLKGSLYLCSVGEINNRDAIEELLQGDKTLYFVSLPPLDDPDLFYVQDLQNMTASVMDTNNQKLEVKKVHNFGAGDILELSDSSMIPFDKEHVTHIDLKNKKITVKLLIFE